MANPLHPPGPYDDFNFSFDPALHNLFQSPTPLPSSADLFSPSETTDLFGFLDNLSWDLDAEVQNVVKSPEAIPPHYTEQPQPPSSTSPPNMAQSSPSHITTQHMQTIQESPANTPPTHPQGPSSSHSSQTPSASEASPTPPLSSSSLNSIQSPNSARPKPLLTTPQKRLNHIMSEQKRRNAIRDGYVQLTTLLAPAGAPPGAGMPTRGRPKGSSSRNNGRTDGKGGGAVFKGKSGILFRAVEYVKWLEEGRDALLTEVLKVEAAAGIHRG